MILDKSCVLQFPAVFRANALQNLLGIDIYQDIEKLNKNPREWVKNLTTKEKSFEVLEILIGETATSDMVERLSDNDYAKLFTLFFSEMVKSNVKVNGETESFVNTTTLQANDHQEVIQ